MSYFSDLAVKKIETDDRDKSYPAPDTQLRWKLEDLVQDALTCGIALTEIESLFDEPKEPVLAVDNELLYSYNSSYSPTLVMRCIKTVLAKLSKYGSAVIDDSEIRIEYNDNLYIRHTLINRRKSKAA